MKKALLVLILITFAARIWQTTGCKNYLPLKFIPAAIKINVEEQVNTDIGQNRQMSRFFHNKVSVGFYEISKSYTKLSDTGLILDILGPLGIVLIALAVRYAFKIKKPYVFAHLIIIFLAPLFAILNQSAKISFFVLSITMYSFSLWGLKMIKPERIQVLGFFLLAVITLWYFAFSWQMPTICNEIFFN